VTVANNGLEALACLEKATFACVLMDVQMPVMDGLEATRRIRQDARFSHLPIIAMTAGALPEERAETVRAGMDDHITKPIDFMHMLAIVGRWVAHGHMPAVEAPAGDAMIDIGRLPELDLAAGLRVTNNKVALFQRLLKSYADDSESSLNRLRALLGSADCHAELQRLVHRLKGSCSTLGLAQVRLATEQLEAAARRGAPLDELTGLFAALEAAEARALRAITEYLREARL